MSEEKKEKEKSAEPTEELKETGSANLEGSRDNHRIKLLTIVGEIEGHEAACRQSFDRRTTGSVGRLFIYRAKRNNGDTSGAV